MRIQKLRLQRGWSQEQLAEVRGLSARTVQRIEKGQVASLETLKALAAAFEVDLAQIQEPDMTPAAPPNVSASAGLDAEEALAFAHVRKVRGFYLHLVQYGIVVGFLAVLNLATSPRYLWFLWVVFGWGVGVMAHAMSLWTPFFGGDWEKRQVEKRLGRKL